VRYFSLAVLFNKHNISLVTDAEVKNYNTRGKKRKQSDINESEIHKRKQKQNSNNGNKKKTHQKNDTSDNSQSDSSDADEKQNKQVASTKEEINKKQTTYKEEPVSKKPKRVIGNQKEKTGKDNQKEEAQDLSGVESNSEDEEEEDDFTKDLPLPEAQTNSEADNTKQSRKEQRR